MRDKAITCIIPCYNCEKYVLKTIESLIHQTIKPIEIILINDASNDNTLEILRETEKEYSDIIKVIDLADNKGASYARNFGVHNSRGDYILFMDSDDIAEPVLIEEYQYRLDQLNYEKEDKYILCYSAYIQIDEKDNQISEIVRGIQVKPEETLGYEFVRNYIISTSGVFVKKDFFIKSGGFNEKIRYSEDWDLWLRLACLGGFAYVDKPLIRIRRHDTNLSSNVVKMLDAEKTILKQYSFDYIKDAVYKRELSIEENTVDFVSILFRIGYWEEGFLELKNLLEQGYSFHNLFFYLGLYYLKHKNVETALEYFEKTVTLKKDHGAALNNLGALYLFNRDKKVAKNKLESAMEYFPSYMDANHNYNLLNKKAVSLHQLRFTWRELRKVLTNYTG